MFRNLSLFTFDCEWHRRFVLLAVFTGSLLYIIQVSTISPQFVDRAIKWMFGVNLAFNFVLHLFTTTKADFKEVEE